VDIYVKISLFLILMVFYHDFIIYTVSQKTPPPFYVLNNWAKN